MIAAAAASFVGGTISVVLFTLFASPLAEVALAFGAAEEFALMVLAFATFIGLGGDDLPKTFFSICIGLVLSAVGLDVISGQPRLIFGDIPGFFHGIHFLVLAIGIYGIGEILWTIEVSKGDVQMSKATISFRRFLDSLGELRGCIKSMLMGSFLGYFVGILPAAGATPGSLMAYGVARSLSRHPETFGKGNLEGVTAPESANNAASTGSMLPMLTLGIPGSPTTAILLGGMVIWGLEPGPMLFVEQRDFVWGLIASLYVANVFTLLINIGFIPLFIWVLKLPFTLLAPIIFVLCVVGGYAPTQDMHDVWLMLGFGVVGYLMRKLDYPMAPAVLAIVLGPLAESSMRQALLISGGSFAIFSRDRLQERSWSPHSCSWCSRCCPSSGSGLRTGSGIDRQTPPRMPGTRTHSPEGASNEKRTDTPRFMHVGRHDGRHMGCGFPRGRGRTRDGGAAGCGALLCCPQYDVHG